MDKGALQIEHKDGAVLSWQDAADVATIGEWLYFRYRDSSSEIRCVQIPWERIALLDYPFKGD